ncbi:hypothetical protein HPB51_015951 [Rhipicephalus microplus]|uniref:Uncharacterized protein n=1 Tax=Rhipicephalus microplus TaxID=6941 RepID=A0A9J6DHX1_RHIMP|nr:hypothetical protein HPB51_015951 [Rhipicephalus microplus]
MRRVCNNVNRAFTRALHKGLRPVYAADGRGESVTAVRTRASPAVFRASRVFSAYTGSLLRGNRPRVCDETAERILERIAARESSDLDLSDSDEEAPEDVAVLDDLEKHLEPDVDSSDEEPVHTAPAAPKRAALWKTTDRYDLLFLVTKTRAYLNFKTNISPSSFEKCLF